MAFGTPDNSKIIGLLDMDYFYAQCEQARNPELKGKPVAVIVPSLRKGGGAIAASSYEARKLKIRSGMPLALAKKLSDENTFFIKADKEYYRGMSERVFEVLGDFCERVEQVSVDEAYFDLTNPEGFFRAKSTARNVKRMVKNEVGLTCSIGVSINKMLAKMASDEDKPDGFTVVGKDGVESFLLGKKLSEIPGVGPKTERELAKMNVKKVSDLREVGPQKLIEVFGKTKGVRLREFSFGRDDRKVEPNREKQQLSRMMTIEKDSSDFSFVYSRADFLCERVYRQASLSGKSFKTATLIVVTPEIRTITRSRTSAEPLKSPEDLKRMIKKLLQDFFSEGLGKVRRVGVRVSNFDEERGRQKKLFDFG